MRIPTLAITAFAIAVGLQGQVRADDEAKAKPAKHEALFTQLDANADGSISTDEVPEDNGLVKRLFRKGDADGDGTLSKAEFVAALREKRAKGPKPEKPAGDRPDRPSPEMITKKIMEADADGDGKISKEEAPERLARGFDRMDADGDGFLTPEEITSAMKAFQKRAGKGPAKGPKGENAEARRPSAEMIVKKIMQSDEDGDGQISREEAPERLAKVFDRVDIDADGMLVEEEITESVEAMLKRGGQGRPGAGGPPNPEAIVKRWMELDKDGDGRVSKDEAPERMQRFFDRIDANGDEFLDKKEIKTSAKAMAKRFKQDKPKKAGKKRPKGEKKPEAEAE